MNGGAGLRFDGRLVTESTTGVRVRSAALCARAVASLSIASGLPPIRTTSAASWLPSGAASSASRVQYSRATNAPISRSRSTTIRSATDWTRPADSPPRTLRDRSGLRV